jgi:hypothetical protein
MTERRPPGIPGGADVGRTPDTLAALANEKTLASETEYSDLLDRGTARNVVLCRPNTGATDCCAHKEVAPCERCLRNQVMTVTVLGAPGR